MDFSTNTDDTQIRGDLELDRATHDIAVDESELGPVMAAVLELFEMRPADDLSYPDLYSRQREYQDADDPVAQQKRRLDAKRLLSYIPEIDQDTINITFASDGVMDVEFLLVSGAQGVIRL